MGKRLLLIGGGGHCHSVLDIVLASKEYNEIGIIDNIGGDYLGIPVIGRDADLPRLFLDGWTDAFITVGSIGNTKIRRHLYNMVKEIGLMIPKIIDPTAIVGSGVVVEEGSFLGKRVVINAGSSIGTCAIVNTGAIVEHDCKIGAFAHISPGTVLCGQVSVGDDSHVGAGSTVRQLIKIGDNSLVGVGSVVVEDIPSNVRAYGSPCRVVE